MISELNNADKYALQKRGITEKKVAEQAEKLMEGTRSPLLISPCTIENKGIRLLDEDELSALEKEYESLKKDLKINRFVPASGAASRMFKALISRLQGKNTELSTRFIQSIEEFPFYEELRSTVEKKGAKWDVLLQDHPESILELLLREPMNYAGLPKGMVAFHMYDESYRTAFAEQMHEASWYAENQSKSHTHFTLPENAVNSILDHLRAVSEKLKEKGEQADYSYSVQYPDTDTVALDEDQKLVRKANGELLFRPGGHGALIKNLNELDADLVFIKNIDNVVPDHLKPEALRYKKPLAGLALKLRKETGEWLRKIESGNTDLAALKKFISEELNVRGIDNASSDELVRILKRPIRICGMVKNQGEPGGGPFWTQMPDGSISPQIIEKAQIDLDNSDQKAILEASTHFNPVDIVAVLTDENGQSYDLEKYIDHATAFIAQKSYEGKDIRALEHPGLWNGAMAFWNTVFVEVPLITFNPVKTVIDLLRPAHQPPRTKA